MNEIKINTPIISFSFDRIMRETWAVMNVLFSGLDKISQDEIKELVNNPLGDGDFKFAFTQINADHENINELTKNWLIERGLEQIVRGVNESLYLADEILNTLKLHGKKFDSDKSIKTILENIKTESMKQHLPTLIDRIEKDLDYQFPLSNYVKSINGARRIYVHRNKRVDSKNFTLSYISHRMVVDVGDKELNMSEVIGKPLEKKGLLKLKKEPVNNSYKKGELISIDLKSFTDMAMTCYSYVQSIAHKENEYVLKTLNK